MAEPSIGFRTRCNPRSVHTSSLLVFEPLLSPRKHFDDECLGNDAMSVAAPPNRPSANGSAISTSNDTPSAKRAKKSDAELAFGSQGKALIFATLTGSADPASALLEIREKHGQLPGAVQPVLAMLECMGESRTKVAKEVFVFLRQILVKIVRDPKNSQ
eukprot:gene5343-5372_t